MQRQKTFKILISIVIVFLVLIFLQYFYIEDEIIDLKIGVIAPLSGEQAFIGQDFKNGMELRLPEKISVIFEDSYGDITKAISAYNKLKLDNIDILVVVGAGDEALIPLVDADKIPTILTVSSTGGLPTKSKYVFRYFTNADIDVPVMIKYITESLDIKNVGIIHIQDNYGISYKDVFVLSLPPNTKGW